MNFDKTTPLIKIIDESNENILYYGEGGIGKSTQFIAAFCYYSKHKEIVAVYFECKDLNFSDYDNAIADKIHSSYTGKETDTRKVQSFLNDISMQDEYTYYIFVDGFNELSKEKKSSLINEINKLSSNKMRFFISSRVKESFKFNHKNVEIKPLKKGTVISYLNDKLGHNYDEGKINDSLIEILNLPFFLNIFVKTYQNTDILPDIYTNKNIKKADILDAFIQKLLDEKSNDLAFKYVLNYFLPALAFEMVKENTLSVSYDFLDEFCENKAYFKKISKAKLVDCDIDDINNIAVSNFALLKYNDEKFTFSHQIWRDYFCAKHIVNCLNTTYNDTIEKDLEISLPFEIEKFAGQLLHTFDENLKYAKAEQFPPKKTERKCECDFESKSTTDDEMSPIENYMQKHSLIEESPLSSIATKNLINIMKAARNYNITACYNDLDLRKTLFFEDNDNLQNSTFDGAKIIKESFMPKINGDILFIATTENGKTSAYLSYSAGKYTIYVTFENSFQNKQLHNLTMVDLINKASYISMSFYDNDTKIAINLKGKNIFIEYSTITQEFELKEHTNDEFEFDDKTVKYQNHIINIEQNNILIDNEVVYTANENYKIMSYSASSNYLAVGREDGDIDIFKCYINRKKLRHLYQIFNDLSHLLTLSLNNDNFEFYNGEDVYKCKLSDKDFKFVSNFAAFYMRKLWCTKNNYTIFETYSWHDRICISLFDRKQNNVVDIKFFTDKHLKIGEFNGRFVLINDKKELEIWGIENKKLKKLETKDISDIDFNDDEVYIEFSDDEKSILLNGKTVCNFDFDIDFNEEIYKTYNLQNYVPIIHANILNCDFNNADFCDDDNISRQLIEYSLSVNGAKAKNINPIVDDSLRPVIINTKHLVSHLANKYKLDLPASVITKIRKAIIFALNLEKLAENEIYTYMEDLIKQLKKYYPSDE